VIPQDVDHRVRNIIASHLDVDVHRLSPDTRLGEDLCVDSLTAVELLMVLEDEFDIALPEQETSSLVTYGDLLTVVADRVGAEA
jgi:acyl carrier protein